jgi:signal peptidase I
MAARSRLRIIVEWVVFLALAAMFSETWLLSGAVVPCRVVGGSMAPALLGIHREVACADCGLPFPCGIDAGRTPPRAVCPNCGCSNDNFETLPNVPGDWLLLDREAFAFRPPRRWEVVALRWPRRADAVVLKRVVGLPGESVEIRDGDVYIDGLIERKFLEQQRAMAILVHDAAHRPTREQSPPPRWRAERPDSRWNASEKGFSHPAGPANIPIDWLVYHHARQSGKDFVESPVADVASYDPLRPRREEDVHPVADLMLSFRLSGVSGQGIVYVRADDGREHFEARLHFDQAVPWYEARRGRQPIPNGEGNMSPGTDSRSIEVSLVDRQFLLAVDGRTVVRYPCEPSRLPTHSTSIPFAIGIQGMEAAVDELRVYRDIYYTQPIKPSAPPTIVGSVVLGAGEYFVLGDNSPVSEDSRHWLPHGAIDAKLLIGKPLIAIPSVGMDLTTQWHIHVPNPMRIRYIY